MAEPQHSGPRESTRVAEHQPPGAGEHVELFKTLIKSCEELKDKLFSTTFLAGNPPFPGRSDNSQQSGSAGLTTITGSSNYLDRHPEAAANVSGEQRRVVGSTIELPGSPEQETAPALRPPPMAEGTMTGNEATQRMTPRPRDNLRAGSSQGLLPVPGDQQTMSDGREMQPDHRRPVNSLPDHHQSGDSQPDYHRPGNSQPNGQPQANKQSNHHNSIDSQTNYHCPGSGQELRPRQEHDRGRLDFENDQGNPQLVGPGENQPLPAGGLSRREKRRTRGRVYDHLLSATSLPADQTPVGVDEKLETTRVTVGDFDSRVHVQLGDYQGYWTPSPDGLETVIPRHIWGSYLNYLRKRGVACVEYERDRGRKPLSTIIKLRAETVEAIGPYPASIFIDGCEKYLNVYVTRDPRITSIRFGADVWNAVKLEATPTSLDDDLHEATMLYNALIAAEPACPVSGQVIRGPTLPVLLDTGCSISVMRRSALQYFGKTAKDVVSPKNPVEICQANNQKLMAYGTVSRVPFYIGGNYCELDFVVLDDLENQLIILGRDFIRKYDVLIDLPRGKMVMRDPKIQTQPRLLTEVNPNRSSFYARPSEGKQIKSGEIQNVTYKIQVRNRKKYRGALEIPDGSQFYVEPDKAEQQPDGLYAGRCLVIVENGRFQVPVANFHESDTKHTSLTLNRVWLTPTRASYVRDTVRLNEHESDAPRSPYWDLHDTVPVGVVKDAMLQCLLLDDCSLEEEESWPSLSSHFPLDDDPKADPNGFPTRPQVDPEAAGLNLEQVRRLEDILSRYKHLFLTSNSDIGCCKVYKQEIFLRHDAPYFHESPRRTSPEKRAAIDVQVRNLLEMGLIEECRSPYASGVVLVKKHDGRDRFCVDYRKLNAHTIPDRYPIPDVKETIDKIGDARYFSTLDMGNAFWQIPLHEGSRDVTAFVTHLGLFRWKFMPQGHCNSPAAFQRMMDRALSNIYNRYGDLVLVYIDDLLIATRTIDQHLDRIEQVFFAMQQAGLKFKAAKCKLFCEEVKFLGRVISKEGVSVNIEAVQKVLDWAQPRCRRDVQSFLGFTNYYREFIKDYSKVAAPLSALTGSNSEFKWTAACSLAFEELKRCMTTTPVLALPSNEGHYVLDTDASEVAIAGILHQTTPLADDCTDYDRSKLRVIAYASRKLDKAERGYPAGKKELLAVAEFVGKQFRPYLFGARFTLRVDCEALQFLKTYSGDQSGVVQRWIAKLSGVFVIPEVRPRGKHTNADGLSKCTQFYTQLRNFEALGPDLDPLPRVDFMSPADWDVIPALHRDYYRRGRKGIQVAPETVDAFTQTGEEFPFASWEQWRVISDQGLCLLNHCMTTNEMAAEAVCKQGETGPTIPGRLVLTRGAICQVTTEKAPNGSWISPPQMDALQMPIHAIFEFEDPGGADQTGVPTDEDIRAMDAETQTMIARVPAKGLIRTAEVSVQVDIFENLNALSYRNGYCESDYDETASEGSSDEFDSEDETPFNYKRRFWCAWTMTGEDADNADAGHREVDFELHGWQLPQAKPVVRGPNKITQTDNFGLPVRPTPSLEVTLTNLQLIRPREFEVATCSTPPPIEVVASSTPSKSTYDSDSYLSCSEELDLQRGGMFFNTYDLPCLESKRQGQNELQAVLPIEDRQNPTPDWRRPVLALTGEEGDGSPEMITPPIVDGRSTCLVVGKDTLSPDGWVRAQLAMTGGPPVEMAALSNTPRGRGEVDKVWENADLTRTRLRPRIIVDGVSYIREEAPVSRVTTRPGIRDKDVWRSQRDVHRNPEDSDRNVSSVNFPRNAYSEDHCERVHPGVVEWPGQYSDDNGVSQVSNEFCFSDPSSLGEETPSSPRRVEEVRRRTTNHSVNSGERPGGVTDLSGDGRGARIKTVNCLGGSQRSAPCLGSDPRPGTTRVSVYSRGGTSPPPEWPNREEMGAELHDEVERKQLLYGTDLHPKINFSRSVNVRGMINYPWRADYSRRGDFPFGTGVDRFRNPNIVMEAPRNLEVRSKIPQMARQSEGNTNRLAVGAVSDSTPRSLEKQLTRWNRAKAWNGLEQVPVPPMEEFGDMRVIKPPIARLPRPTTGGERAVTSHRFLYDFPQDTSQQFIQLTRGEEERHLAELKSNFELRDVYFPENPVEIPTSTEAKAEVLLMALRPRYGVKQLIEAQEDDPSLSVLRRILLEEEEQGRRFTKSEIDGREDYLVLKPQSKCYFTRNRKQLQLKDGVLVRRIPETDARTAYFVLVVPQLYRYEILSICHDKAGHVGQAKTIARVKAKFDWPGLDMQAREYCDTCHRCQLLKRVQPVVKKKLKTISSACFNDLVQVDYEQLAPTSSEGVRWLLVIIDHFTKWVEAIPMYSTTAEETAEAIFRHWICVHGPMRRLQSDQGPQFEAELFQHFFWRLGVQKTRSTGYHPETQGLVERMNRTLIKMIRVYLSDFQDWTQVLHIVLYAYRTCVHETTGLTPYFLLYGREAPSTLEYLFPDFETPRLMDYGGFADVRIDRMARANKFARQHMGAAQRRQAKYYDRKVAPAHEYKVGDRVLLFCPAADCQRMKKLRQVLVGPLKIEEILDEDQRLFRLSNNRVVNWDNIRPFLHRPIHFKPADKSGRWVTLQTVEVPPDSEDQATWREISNKLDEPFELDTGERVELYREPIRRYDLRCREKAKRKFSSDVFVWHDDWSIERNYEDLDVTKDEVHEDHLSNGWAAFNTNQPILTDDAVREESRLNREKRPVRWRPIQERSSDTSGFESGPAQDGEPQPPNEEAGRILDAEAIRREGLKLKPGQIDATMVRDYHDHIMWKSAVVRISRLDQNPHSPQQKKGEGEKENDDSSVRFDPAVIETREDQTDDLSEIPPDEDFIPEDLPPDWKDVKKWTQNKTPAASLETPWRTPLVEIKRGAQLRRGRQQPVLQPDERAVLQPAQKQRRLKAPEAGTNSPSISSEVDARRMMATRKLLDSEPNVNSAGGGSAISMHPSVFPGDSIIGNETVPTAGEEFAERTMPGGVTESSGRTVAKSLRRYPRLGASPMETTAVLKRLRPRAQLRPAGEWKFQCMLLDDLQGLDYSGGEDSDEDEDEYDIQASEHQYLGNSAKTELVAEGDEFWRHRSPKMELAEIAATAWPLPAVPADGKYTSCAQYQAVQCQLLREEGLQRFRHALQKVQMNKGLTPDIPRFTTVRILAYQPTPRSLAVLLQFPGPSPGRKRLWKGSLLYFREGNEILGMGNVKRRYSERMKEMNFVLVELDGGHGEALQTVWRLQQSSGKMELMECPQYYLSFAPAVERCQKKKNLPLWEALTGARAVLPPEYIEKQDWLLNYEAIYHRAGRTPQSVLVAQLRNAQLPEGYLDPSQCEAIAHALSHEVAIIRGPPGCGKTTVVTTLVDVLASIPRRERGPIMILSAKNLTVDSILERLRPRMDPSRICRLGRVSKMPSLLQNLKALRKEAQRNKRDAEMQRQLRLARRQLNRVNDELSELDDLLDTDGWHLESAVWRVAQELSSAQILAVRKVTGDYSTDPVELVAGWLLGDLVPIPEVVGREGWIHVRQPRRLEEVVPLALEGVRERLWGRVRETLMERPGTLLERHGQRLVRCQEELEELENEINADILAHLDVIGGTVTNAILNHECYSEVGPRIVVVEEAAEILDVLLMAALPSSVQHLILVGDPQQLSPRLDVPHLGNLGFGRSRMEELLLLGSPSVQLRVQNRMGPGLSGAVRQIYEQYDDGPVAFRMTAPDSLRTSLTWFDIQGTEKACTKYVNEKEAWAAIILASWMMRNGHSPTEITILTAYRQQVDAIRQQADLVWPGDWQYQLLVTTVDAFQGRENNIVILSTVRSNRPRKLGFLADERRRCVAISRARRALMVVGSVRTFSASHHWRNFIELIRPNVGLNCPVRCSFCGNWAQILSIRVGEQLARAMTTSEGCLCKAKLKSGALALAPLGDESRLLRTPTGEN